MGQFSLPRLRASALPPIGRKVSYTCPGVTLRAAGTFSAAIGLLVLLLVNQTPREGQFREGQSSSTPVPR